MLFAALQAAAALRGQGPLLRWYFRGPSVNMRALAWIGRDSRVFNV